MTGERNKEAEGCLRNSDYKIEPKLYKGVMRKQKRQ